MATASRPRRGPGGSLVIAVTPPGSYRFGGRVPDRVSRHRGRIYERFLHVDGHPVLARAWAEPRTGTVAIAALPAPEPWLARRCERPAADDELERAIARIRHALAVDDDLLPFRRRFARDPLLGPLLRRLPHYRVHRCPNAWEAFAWAVTEQLNESREAAAIQRRIVARWGAALRGPVESGARPLADVPAPDVIAGLAPAELAACGLAPKRALALIKGAREIAAGRCDPADPGGDARLLRISEIGPWTIQCLALKGRGDLDSLPAGDVAYLKLVGRLAGLGRRATVAEVEEFYAPYAPWRGLAARFTLVGSPHEAGAQPLRYHPPNPEYEAA
jgi:3-methyladenine DNA glycosylase/8-oxoguanine DNA glycosylase